MSNIIAHPSQKTQAKPIEYIITENGCWECISHSRDKDGYARVHLNYRHRRMTHIVYEIFKGVQIERPNILLHSCDNPPCINPEHLRVGTHKDNMHEKTIRNRISGNRNPNSKLSLQQVSDIREETSGASYEELGRIYNVAGNTINDIKNRRTWK